MTAGTRIQRRRARGWRTPENTVIVTYPTKWQNPYRPVVAGVHKRSNAEAVALYREHLAQHPELVAAARQELAGKNLACYCPLDKPCHADVLLEVANTPTA